MSRFLHPQVATANDLREGDVVYFTENDTWSRALSDAAVAHDSEAAQSLLVRANEQRDVIVGAYLADVSVDENGTISPVHFREVFRTRGPSNYFHGKQAGA